MYRNLILSSRSIGTSAIRQKADTDLITNVFLKQIRDLAAKQKAAGGSLVNTSADIKKQLDEQLNRLANKFKLPSTDIVGKLAIEFEKPQVESSVAAVIEGKSLDELISQVKASHAAYEKERAEKKKIEAAQQAMLNQGSEITVEPKPAHMFNDPVHGNSPTYVSG